MMTPDVLPKSGEKSLSLAQEKLWSRMVTEPANGRFNVPCALRITGPVDLRVLNFSLNEIVRRHEILRTTFAHQEKSALPRVAAELQVEIASLEQPAPSGAELKRLADEEASRPFDLARGPLLRATLFRLEKEKHLLLVVMHQMIADPGSLAIFQRELALLYGSFSQGQASPLPEVSSQFCDFAAWQRRRMQGEALEKLLSYWRKQLDAACVLALPADRSRLPVPTFRGARLDFRLPEPLGEALRKLCSLEGATPFMALLAAFQLLLCRYCGQDDIAVGVPIANRDRAESAGGIGPFANTLVMRCDLGGNPTFRELLRRVREVAQEALAHQELPFEVLAEDLDQRGNQAQAPLFQVMFELQELPTTAPAFSGCTVETFPVGTGSARCDLTLSLVDAGGELKGAWEYSTDLFNASTIERMAGHFRVLLDAIVADPNRCLADLPLLTEAERHRLLVEWNDTAREFPRSCLHELCEAQAERTPDAVAVVYESSQLTYRELHVKANQLAHRLRKLGVGPDTLVGVYMERSLEMVIALLGILKSGGAYLPLDPVYPVDRLSYMLELSATPVILTQSRLAGAMPPNSARLIRLDGEWAEISGEPAEPPRSVATPENLAYVMFTSGSTGRPKGVEISHAGVCNRLLWAQEVFRYGASDRILQKTPFSFDVSLWEFFSPLIAGSTLVMARPEGHRDSRYLAEVIRDQRITAVHFVPSMLQLYLDEEGACAPTLSRVVCSGEALPRELMRRFQKLMKAELHNLYGPTEASVEVTWWDCSRELPCETVPIGRPIANIRLYVLDPNLQPVPVGVPGELHIGGVGVARGYLNQPELTAAKFIPDLFSELASARLYKTGDRVRFLPDGSIEFLGRLDNQVKIRGNRVEPAEIESVLERHPEIKEAVVLPRQDASGNVALVAYLVLEKGVEPCPNAVREFLKEKVPGYMVPSAFVFLDCFPLTASGKVDRKSLPAPEVFHAEAVAGADDRLPDALEQGLVQIWEELLNVRPIGLRDNFFDLGGHSLMAIRLFGLIESRFGTRFSPSVLYHAPTIAELAAVIKDGVKADANVKLVSIRPEGDRPPLFCIAPVNHSALCFREITKHLDSAQPVFGIEGNEQILHTPLEQAAADFARVMLNTTPQGPFCLVGYSAGGVIAFEAARQLQEKGHHVHLLAMLDSNSPVQPKPLGIVSRFLRFYRDKGNRIARLRNRAYKTAGFEPPPPDIDEAELRQREFLARVTTWELNYTPQHFSGRVVYFEAEHPPEERATNDWKRFARELEIHPVAGDHTQIVTAAPLTRTIGTVIEAHLSRISAR